ncbi:GNAT family N-acetyltransferase [Nocardia callitridis]|uniref:GNAT family N-acetyltransferase n=1 Tax=Nocardia callitridis TaxID=648753 RepID=A0ABP9K5E6_9NOCA
MTVEVRTLTNDADVRAATDVFRTAMVGLPPMTEPDRPLSEPGRTLGARLDGQLVGAATSFTSWLAVPGGARVPHAAVTRVGVLPTHTRRGVLTALLRRQLDDIAARGEVVASLRASEGLIYERFGYGVASSFVRLNIRRARARLRDSVPPSGEVRLLDRAQAWKVLPQIYTAADIRWTGAIDRPEYWWRQQELMTGDPAYVAVHGPVGAEDGFLRYHPIDTAQWFTGADRTIVVDDLVATTPAALLGLVRYLLSVDLVHTITIAFAAPDNPLPHLFTDPRAVETVAVRDETWLRLVDVPAALNARTYRENAAAVLVEVRDDVLGANTGVYRIAADGVTRVDATADLRTDVAALAAVYLGASSWRQLVVSGRAQESRPGVARSADELFVTDEQPFSGTFF